MAIYDKDGNSITTIYDVNGVNKAEAFDANGEKVFPYYNFKVMSYNCQHFTQTNGNVPIQTEAFYTQNADIVGIQEYKFTWQNLGKIGTTPANTFIQNCGYDYFYVATLDTNMKAIASKYEMTDFTETRFSTTPTDYGTGDEYRSWTKSYFTFNGKQVAFFNTHFDTTTYYEKKVEQAHEIFEALQDEDTFILTGDFNLRSDSTESREYSSIVEQFIDAGYNMCNGNPIYGYHNTWIDGTYPTGTEMYPLDVIITSADIEMVDVVVDDYKIVANTGLYIDHLPIIAYLRI